MNRKVYVVGRSLEYANWMEAKLTGAMEEADLVLFTGGEDVSPSLYGEPANPTTFNDYARDVVELAAFKKAQSLGKHVIGICRGSQFLCVMAGGKLVQNMQNKYSEHPVRLKTGEVITISSTHHQAAYPFNLPEDEYDIIGWGEGLSSFHEGGNKEELSIHPDFKEVEIAYYPRIKALGIQGHPEYGWYKNKPANAESLKYLQTLLTDFLEDKL